MGSEFGELVRGRREGELRQLRRLGSEILGEALWSVEPGADGGAALREPHEPRKHSLDARHAILDLRRIARKLLAERQGSRILKMRAADLDDLVPAICLVGETLVHHPQR